MFSKFCKPQRKNKKKKEKEKNKIIKIEYYSLSAHEKKKSRNLCSGIKKKNWKITKRKIEKSENLES